MRLSLRSLGFFVFLHASFAETMSFLACSLYGTENAAVDTGPRVRVLLSTSAYARGIA